jgi:UDP-N-acetylmuramoylalanine--D-glutamate ligase
MTLNMQELFMFDNQEIAKNHENICVLGGGITGKKVINFLKNKNKNVFLVDSNQGDIDCPSFSDLTQISELPSFSLLIKSPGVNPSHSLLVNARKSNIRILSEISLARSYFKGKILGITGTDGKSTTTALTYALISSCFPKTAIGGNFGIPFIEFCEQDLDFAVLELSSYQLDDSDVLALEASAFLNLAPDHLERHKTMEDYKIAKLKIVSPHRESHQFIFNDRLKNEIDFQNFKCKVLSFGTDRNSSCMIDEKVQILKTNKFEYSTKKFPLFGFHNLENLAASILLAESVNCPPEIIQSALENFTGLEYRFQKIHTYKNSIFINDSKSTNTHSLLSGIKGFSSREKVILILGGRPKDESLEILRSRLLELKPIQVYIYGEAGKIWEKELNLIPTKIVSQPKNALEQIKENWEKLHPEYVIFSPACASFDLYKNFEERGKIFTMDVKKIFAK